MGLGNSKAKGNTAGVLYKGQAWIANQKKLAEGLEIRPKNWQTRLAWKNLDPEEINH
jgi:hypothetical protein